MISIPALVGLLALVALLLAIVGRLNLAIMVALVGLCLFLLFYTGYLGMVALYLHPCFLQRRRHLFRQRSRYRGQPWVFVARYL
jgi:hypothetical protein